MIRNIVMVLSRWITPVVLSTLPYSRGLALKAVLLKMQKVKVGENVGISRGFYTLGGAGIEVGKNSHLGSYLKLHDICKILIGSNALISHDVKMISGTHKLDKERTAIQGEIIIGDNVWIGLNVSIVGPCIIGNDCVIGANSYVTGDFPDHSVLAGTPAKIIKIATYG